MEHRRLTDAPADTADDHDRSDAGLADRPAWNPFQGVRASDIEPYTGLRYLSKLFRFMAIVLALLLVAEIVTGLYVQGAAAIPTLLGEAARLIVLAGVLWGTGDLALLLIDIGHDVRASRILVTRSTHSGRAALFPETSERTGSGRPGADRLAPGRQLPPPLADRPDEPGGR